MMSRSPLPSGRLQMRVNRNGVFVELWEAGNLVVDAGSAILAHLLGGVVVGNSVTQVGFGSGTSAASPGNTSLAPNAFLKPVDAVTFPAANKVAFTISLSIFEANGLALSEYGLLTGTGALFARLVRTAPLIKDQSISLSAVWTITF